MRAAYLQLVDEHGDGVELIVRVRRVSHGERDGDGSCGGILDSSIKVLERWLDVSARKVESLIACEVM